MSFRENPDDKEALQKLVLRRLDGLERKRRRPPGYTVTGAATGSGGLVPGPAVMTPGPWPVYGTWENRETYAGVNKSFGDQLNNFNFLADVEADYKTFVFVQSPVVAEGVTGTGVKVQFLNKPTPHHRMSHFTIDRHVEVGYVDTPFQTFTNTIDTHFMEMSQIHVPGVKEYEYHASEYQAPGEIRFPTVQSPGPGWLVFYVFHKEAADIAPGLDSSGDWQGRVTAPASWELIHTLYGVDHALGPLAVYGTTRFGSCWMWYEYTNANGTTPQRAIFTTNAQYADSPPPNGGIAHTYLLDTRV